MRIAVWYNLHSGGGKRALYHQVKGLTERGHTVEVWSPPVEQKDYLPLSDFAKEHIVPLAFDPTESAGDFARLFAKNRYVYKRQAAFEEHCARCAEEINAGGFDLLLAHPCFRLAISPIARFVKIPSVIYSQEPNRPLYEAIYDFIWKAEDTPADRSPKQMLKGLRETLKVADSRVEVREEWKSAKAFDQILVNSFFSREAHWRAYGLDSQVCYLGIDSETFQYRREEREPFVIGLGAFIPAKNQEFILRALGKVPSPRPRLIWVGNVLQGDDMLNHLKRIADENEVDFEPRLLISDEELISLLNRASVMLHASRLEPFGYAPLEANSCGTPVIAVAEGGMRETIQDGENGLLVENEPDAMAAALSSLLTNPRLARDMGENARVLVETKWSLAAAADRLETRLRTVLDSQTQVPPPENMLPSPRIVVDSRHINPALKGETAPLRD